MAGALTDPVDGAIFIFRCVPCSRKALALRQPLTPQGRTRASMAATFPRICCRPWCGR